MTLDLRPAGTSALLATLDTLDQVLALRAGLPAAGLPGVTEVVSGARTLLFRFDPAVTDAVRVRAAVERVRPAEPGDGAGSGAAASASASGSVGGGGSRSVVGGGSRSVGGVDAAPVVVPVRYDGEDLDAVAALARMSVPDLIAWHTGQVWTSALCGFAPGFSYLTGTAASLDLPRRSSARTSVPSGAVALAGEFSAVYPRASPGGWQLIGRTDVAMWSLDRQPPALAPAGTRVRFAEASA